MLDSYLGEAGFLFPQFDYGCTIGEELFFSAINLNGIYSLNLSTGRICFKNFFEEEKLLSGSLFSVGTVFENRIFFAPFFGDTVQCYDSVNNVAKSMKNGNDNSFFNANYSQMIQSGIYLYCFPVYGTKVIKVNIKEEKIEKIYDIENDYFETFGKQLKVFSNSRLYIFEKIIYGALFDTPAIFKFDTEAEKISFVVFPELENGFEQMEGEGNKLVLLNHGKKMLIFDIINERICKNIILESGIEPKKFHRYYKEGKNICFCSAGGDYILRVNTDTESCELHTVEEEWGIGINKELGERSGYIPDGSGKYAIFASNKGNIVWKNLMNGEIRCIKMSYEPDQEIIAKYKDAGGMCVKENASIMCIENLIAYCGKKGSVMKEDNIGGVIFREMED